MYNNIKIDLIRSECKNVIENLEVWLRNLIDNELTENYNANYLEFLNRDGSRLIKKETSKFEEEFNRLSINIENQHIRTDYAIYCSVISKEDWHRCGDVDDCVAIIYEIAPKK